MPRRAPLLHRVRIHSFERSSATARQWRASRSSSGQSVKVTLRNSSFRVGCLIQRRYGVNIAIAALTKAFIRPLLKRFGSTGNIIVQPSPMALI